jgi:hypothetical protein
VLEYRRRHMRHTYYRWLGPDLIPSLSTQRAVDAYISDTIVDSNKVQR